MGNSVPPGLLLRGGGRGRGRGIVGKIILPDGSIRRYEKHVTVAELMLEYPQQLVFELETSSKRTAMPADKMLEKNKVYLMVPMRKGRPPALSSEEASRILSNANLFLKSKSFLSSSVGFIPLLARIWQAGGVKPGQGLGRGSGHAEGQETANVNKRPLVIFHEEELKEDIFCEFLEERPAYLSKQISGKGWKPSLDTINEKSIKTKVRHWLI